MAFSFPAFSYIIALIVDAFLIFFSIFHVIAFDELKTDYKNPIDQCNSLNPVSVSPLRVAVRISKSSHLLFSISVGFTGVLAASIHKLTLLIIWRMVFVDDKLAFDTVPHTQVRLCCDRYGTLREFIRSSVC